MVVKLIFKQVDSGFAPAKPCSNCDCINSLATLQPRMIIEQLSLDFMYIYVYFKALAVVNKVYDLFMHVCH